MNIIMPMAGLGSRMNRNIPKHLTSVNHRPMFLEALHTFHPDWQQHQVVLVMREEHLEMTRPFLTDNMNVVTTQHITTGPAATTLLAAPYINDDALFTLNCDQVFTWDGASRIADMMHLQAGVFVFASMDAKCSFVQVNDAGCAVQFAEKQVISHLALSGVHYWKHGKDFISSCKKMMADDVRVNNEHYISMTYNYLLDDVCVGVVETPAEEITLLGTEQELLAYESRTII
jgi:dTDP-glucose pyrophosphorylase